MTATVTCAAGHSTTMRAIVSEANADMVFFSMIDSDWRGKPGETPIRCPCGAETVEIEIDNPEVKT